MCTSATVPAATRWPRVRAAGRRARAASAPSPSPPPRCATSVRRPPPPPPPGGGLHRLGGARGVRLARAVRPLPDRRALPRLPARSLTMFRSLSPAEWRRAGALAAAIAALHVVGFGVLLGLVVPGD